MACDQKHKWAHTYYSGAFIESDSETETGDTAIREFPMAQAIQFFPRWLLCVWKFIKKDAEKETYL